MRSIRMHPLTSKRRAKSLSFALFLIGLAIVSYLNSWWPGIMLVIGIPLALRQFLRGHLYDTMVSLFIFIGIFVVVQFNFSWEFLLPVLLIVGAIYVLFREYFDSRTTPEDEEEVDLNEEIEEEQHK